MTLAPYLSQVLKTPFFSRTSAACKSNQWRRWSGYTVVEVYDTVPLEYSAARNSAGVFDLSPLCKYLIEGRDAKPYLNRLVTRDISRLATGRVAYVAWCNDRGMVIDDGTLFCHDDDRYWLCAQERHLPWLLDSAESYDVRITDISDRMAALALQGPTSCAVLSEMGCTGIADLPPYAIAEYDLDGHELLVSRTGFTGDLGYELWIDRFGAEPLWDYVMAAGVDHGVRPMGSLALEMTRIEAGFIQAGAEFVPGPSSLRPGRQRSPFELGLHWMVDFDKGHFNGRRALLRERDSDRTRFQLIGLDIDGKQPATEAILYDRRGRQVGVVTSAMWSPTCKKNIAIASLDRGFSATGQSFYADIYLKRELEWERRSVSCQIVSRPFYKPARRWETPALAR